MGLNNEIKCYEDIFKSSLEQLVSFVCKEGGEMIKSVYIDKDEHWIEELGDLCGLVIVPLLKKAGLTFEEAQQIGIMRLESKLKK